MKSKTPLIQGNKIPYYEQVAHTVNQRIRTGIYQENHKLPSVRELSKDFNVSINVIQRAFRKLEIDGVVKSQPGKGIIVASNKQYNQSALLFGFIHPFTTDTLFEQHMLQVAEGVFSNRDNLLICQSSQLDVSRERKIAEHLIHNGVQGLLLWPNESNPNGDYFRQLSTQIPIILIDRLLPGVQLPAVTTDAYQAGKNICQHAFTNLKCKRLLAIMDTLNTSVYHDLISGLKEQADTMNMSQNLTVMFESIFDCIKQISHCDYRKIDVCKLTLQRLLQESQYDALFCPHEDFLDFAIFQTDLHEKFPQLKIITNSSGQINDRSRRYTEADITKFKIDFPTIISTAADILQEFVFKRTYNTKVTLIPQRLLQ